MTTPNTNLPDGLPDDDAIYSRAVNRFGWTNLVEDSRYKFSEGAEWMRSLARTLLAAKDAEIAELREKLNKPKGSRDPRPGDFNYVVSYGGGVGPDVWDSEMTISAVDISDAISQAIGQMEESGGWVFMVSQEDYPMTTREKLEEKLEQANARIKELEDVAKEGDYALRAARVSIAELTKERYSLRAELEAHRIDSQTWQKCAQEIRASINRQTKLFEQEIASQHAMKNANEMLRLISNDSGGVESRHAVEECSETPEKTESASMALNQDIEVTKPQPAMVEKSIGITRGGAGEPNENRSAGSVEDSESSASPAVTISEQPKGSMTIEHILLSITITSDETSAGQFDDSCAYRVQETMNKYHGVKSVDAEVLYKHTKIEHHVHGCSCHYCEKAISEQPTREEVKSCPVTSQGARPVAATTQSENALVSNPPSASPIPAEAVSAAENDAISRCLSDHTLDTIETLDPCMLAAYKCFYHAPGFPALPWFAAYIRQACEDYHKRMVRKTPPAECKQGGDR